MCPLIPNEDLSICRSTHNVLLISFANKGVVHEIRLGSYWMYGAPTLFALEHAPFFSYQLVTSELFFGRLIATSTSTARATSNPSSSASASTLWSASTPATSWRRCSPKLNCRSWPCHSTRCPAWWPTFGATSTHRLLLSNALRSMRAKSGQPFTGTRSVMWRFANVYVCGGF